ncbi:MAG: ABC transporter substrate-binding protein [Actinomycetota bacterium]
MTRRLMARLAAVVAASTLLVAACGSGEESSDDASGTAPDAADNAATESADGSEEDTSAGDNGQAEDGSSEDDQSEDGSSGDGADSADFPRTVTDAIGTVEIPAPPARVVALDQSMLDIAFVLGLEVIGYTTFADPDGPIPEIYAEAAAELAAEAEWLGDLLSPNLEAIAGARPDLILTSVVRHETISDQLSQIAPTVMSESAGGGWKDALRLAAEATGREAVAEQAIADYEARAAALGSSIRDEFDDPTISVVRFVDVIRLYQPVSFSGVVLADAGLARPASQQDTENFISVISIEEIADADADVIVYATFDDPRVTETVTEVVAGPLWGQLTAVQAGNVHAVEDSRWMTAVGLFGANAILDDLAAIFGVEAG